MYATNILFQINNRLRSCKELEHLESLRKCCQDLYREEALNLINSREVFEEMCKSRNEVSRNINDVHVQVTKAKKKKNKEVINHYQDRFERLKNSQKKLDLNIKDFKATMRMTERTAEELRTKITELKSSHSLLTLRMKNVEGACASAKFCSAQVREDSVKALIDAKELRMEIKRELGQGLGGNDGLADVKLKKNPNVYLLVVCLITLATIIYIRFYNNV